MCSCSAAGGTRTRNPYQEPGSKPGAFASFATAACSAGGGATNSLSRRIQLFSLVMWPNRLEKMGA